MVNLFHAFTLCCVIIYISIIFLKKTKLQNTLKIDELSLLKNRIDWCL